MLRKYLCIHPEGVAGAVIMGTGAMPDSTMKFGLFLCRTIALFRGWHYRSRLMQSLSYSKPYKRYDLYGKDYANSWLSKNVENVKAYYADPVSYTHLLTDFDGNEVLPKYLTVDWELNSAGKNG